MHQNHFPSAAQVHYSLHESKNNWFIDIRHVRKLLNKKNNLPNSHLFLVNNSNFRGKTPLFTLQFDEPLRLNLLELKP